MRFVQFIRNDDGFKRLGIISEDGFILTEISLSTGLSNDMLEFIRQGKTPKEIQTIVEQLESEAIGFHHKILAPLDNPGKIIGINVNFFDQCREQKIVPPEEPVFYSKSNNALIGPDEEILLPMNSEQIDWAATLAVVMGKTAVAVPEEDAMDYVFGYSVAQDITAREWEVERNGGQLFISKSMDTFFPIGPAIVHKSLVPEPNRLGLKTIVNGRVKQNGNTCKMCFQIEELISILSSVLTLEAGDIILTGTCRGVGMCKDPPEYLKPGDVIQTEIQSVGRLLNRVAAEEAVEDAEIEGAPAVKAQAAAAEPVAQEPVAEEA